MLKIIVNNIFEHEGDYFNGKITSINFDDGGNGKQINDTVNILRAITVLFITVIIIISSLILFIISFKKLLIVISLTTRN